jgi:hypothetical protein
MDRKGWLQLKKTLSVLLCAIVLFSITINTNPSEGSKGSNVAYASEAAVHDAVITRAGDQWTLENEVLRTVIAFNSGSIEMKSFYNKEASKEYLTGAGDNHLFDYEFDNVNHSKSDDGGWTLGTPTSTDITMKAPDQTSVIGKQIKIPVIRTSPQAIQVTLVFEIYNGRAGLRYYTLIKNNNPAAETTITKSDVIALNFDNQPHTIHYVPNMIWKSTTGALSPFPENTSSAGKRAELPKNALTVYNTMDGWSLNPELNWKTEKGNGNYATDYMLPPFASINAWYNASNVKIVTNPESLQLVLFPNEEFEYISVNMTVFKGDVIDGKMAVEEHLRKRFKYNDVTTLFNTNDWDYRGGPGKDLPPNYYYDTIIPKAKKADFDMVMLDDLWNTTRDTIVSSDIMNESIHSLSQFSQTLTDNGFKFGLWFSLTGAGHNGGRDLADPSNIAFKKGQIETLINDFHLSHQMIDLTEYWQNEATTAYSHASDNVYRKNVLVRNMLNELVTKYPHYLPKLTSELDIAPTQGDRNNGLMHIAYNGWNTSNGGVTGEDLSLRTAITGFGHLPMEAAYMNIGKMTGKMEDYYSYMAVRNVKFGQDPGDESKWPEAAVNLMAKFNKWRKSDRITALTEELFRPVYLGNNWDSTNWNSSTGPYVWMYTDESRSKALMIATGTGAYASTVFADLRWLADNKTYMISDITLDDNGTNTYAFRGTFTGAELKAPGFPIDLNGNTSKGKAFWIQETKGNSLQVQYADEFVKTYTETAASDQLTVHVTGEPLTVGKVIVVDPVHNTAVARMISLDASGQGNAVISAEELLPPVAVPSIFPETIYYEAENLPYTANPSNVTSVTTEANASNGGWSYSKFTAVGQQIEYTLNVPSDGMYQIDIRYKENENRGKSQLYIDNQLFGPEVNHFYTINMYKGIEFRERYLGNRELTAGQHKFKFQTTGTSGSKYEVGVDYIKLTPTAIKQPLKFEAENVYSASNKIVGSTGDNAASPANNGKWHSLPATAVGDWVAYKVNVPAAGTYKIKTVAKTHMNRGKAQLYVDNNLLGGVMDQYLPISDGAYQFKEFDNGNYTFDTSGDKILKYVVTGKSSGSGVYSLATDYITFTPVPKLNLGGSDTIAAGEQTTLTVGYKDMEAYYSKPQYLLWTVESESVPNDVVTVNENGVVTGLRGGTAVIKARSQIAPEAYATFSITVTPKPPADATLAADITAPTNTDVTVTISYPADAAVKEYKVGANGIWTAYITPVIVSENGTVYARGANAAGKVSNVTNVVISNIDKIAPISVASLNPASPNGSNGWYTSDVTVSLSVYDNLSGVAKTEYQVNNGDWITYTGFIPAFGEGIYKINYRSTDQAGNVEQVQTIEFKIDKAAPSLTVQLDTTSIWPPNHKMVTIHAALNSGDAASGVASVVLTSITSNEPDSGQGDIGADLGTTATSFSLRADRLGNGAGRIYTITYTITDNAGNTSTAVNTVSVPHNQ